MAISMPSFADFLRTCQTLQQENPCACNGLDVEKYLPEAERIEEQQNAVRQAIESMHGPDLVELSPEGQQAVDQPREEAAEARSPAE